MHKFKYLILCTSLLALVFVWRNSTKHVPNLREMKQETNEYIKESIYNEYIKDTAFSFQKYPSRKEVIITVDVKLKPAFTKLTMREQYSLISKGQRYLQYSYKDLDSYNYIFDIKAVYEDSEYVYHDATRMMRINNDTTFSESEMEEYHNHEINANSYTSNGYLKSEIYDYVIRMYNVMTSNGKNNRPDQDSELIIKEVEYKFGISKEELQSICKTLYIEGCRGNS